jgi:hypothetical protein
VESVTWTDERGPIPAGIEVGRGFGCITGTVFGGVAALVLCVGLGLSWWWAVFSWLAAFSLGSTIKRSLVRMVVYRMEFTRSSVRLVRPTSTRTVAIAAVEDINVQHSADGEHTSVQLTYARSVAVTTIAVTNRFDPTLAGRLTEVLGPGVRVRETNTVQDP